MKKKLVIFAFCLFIQISMSQAKMGQETNTDEITQVNADMSNELNKLKSNFATCTELFDKYEKNCPEKWRYKCYNILMDAHKKTQQCYMDVAKDLFLLYYNQEQTQTQKMFNEIANFTYKNHLYIYQESEYCKKIIAAYQPTYIANTPQHTQLKIT